MIKRAGRGTKDGDSRREGREADHIKEKGKRKKGKDKRGEAGMKEGKGRRRTEKA